MYNIIKSKIKNEKVYLYEPYDGSHVCVHPEFLILQQRRR